MVAATRRGHGATFADLVAYYERHEEKPYCEIVGGEIVRKAQAGFDHGDVSSTIIEVFKGPYHRGRGGPGGWWIAPEVTIEFEIHEVYVPDVAGWRKDRVPERPSGYPVRIRPDWVCEVLSKSTAHRDIGEKLLVYHRTGVGHYWIVDRMTKRFIVYRHSPEGYVLVLSAGPRQIVRAEPFQEVELDVGLLFTGSDEPAD